MFGCSCGAPFCAAWNSVREMKFGLQEITVNKEVLLSAGPYHSPKLLLLSGIGPSAMLQNFSIPVVADLPVGQSAQVRARQLGVIKSEQKIDSLVHTEHVTLIV